MHLPLKTTLRICAMLLATWLISPGHAEPISLPREMPRDGETDTFHRSLVDLAGRLRNDPALAESAALALLLDEPGANQQRNGRESGFCGLS